MNDCISIHCFDVGLLENDAKWLSLNHFEVYSMKLNENVSNNNKYNWISSWY